MTNIEELIKALHTTDFHQDCDYCEHSNMCDSKDCIILQAADALEALQTENIALRAERDALLKSVKATSTPIEVIQPRGITE